MIQTTENDRVQIEKLKVLFWVFPADGTLVRIDHDAAMRATLEEANGSVPVLLLLAGENVGGLISANKPVLLLGDKIEIENSAGTILATTRKPGDLALDSTTGAVWMWGEMLEGHGDGWFRLDAGNRGAYSRTLNMSNSFGIKGRLVVGF
jgi:hypothetical protein